MTASIAKIEERIDRVAAGSTEISTEVGGIRFQNMMEVMEFAKLMSVAGNAVPKHMQGNPGMCLAVCVQALEWRFSPFSVANKSYEVQGRLCFESQLVHALIEQRAPIKGRLKHKFEGEGDERRCIVSAVLRETGEPLEYISPPFGKILPKNSPLWKTKPDLQHYYNTSRDFCRVYFPDVILGVFADDELRDHAGPDNAKEVGNPGLRDRLKGGGKGRGFSQDHVEQHTTRGVIDESARQVDAASQSDQPQSSQPSTPSAETTPAADVETVSLTGAAGTQSQDQESPGHPPGDAGQQADGTGAQVGLPPGWEKEYAGALRRAVKKTSLEKLAKQFWDQYGGWLAHKDTETGSVANQIYDAFFLNFGNKDAIDGGLRELGAL